MGANLAKTPLLAVLYASLISFAAALIPYSQGYAEARAAAPTPFSGYLLLIAYGLWIAIAAAIIFSAVKVSVASALLLGVSFIGLQWVAPNLQQLMFGQSTGVMTGQDNLCFLLIGAFSTILLLVLCMLLLKSPETAVGGKYKIKPVALVVWVFVLPLIYMILYFLTWYFIAWRNGAVREYYIPGAVDNGFIAVMIDMLLTNARMVPFAMLQGFLYMALSLPLLITLAGKRVMYMAATIMLFLSGALWQLVPSAAVPAPVRMAQLAQYAVQLLVYGVACTVFLYMIMQKPEVIPAPAPAKAGGKAPPTAGRPAAARK